MKTLFVVKKYQTSKLFELDNLCLNEKGKKKKEMKEYDLYTPCT